MQQLSKTQTDPLGPIIGRNLMTFGRRLRKAGLKVGTGKIIELFDALETIRLERMDDVYAASRAVLVNRPDQVPAFDVEFVRFWQDLISQMPAFLDQPAHQDAAGGEPPEEQQEQSDKKTESQDEAEDGEEKATLAVQGSEDLDEDSDTEDFEAPPEDVLVFSSSESLRKKDFSQFTPEEMARARRLMERMHWRLGTRKTRRREKSRQGEFIDQRTMLRASMKHGGVPMELKFRRRREKMRPLVLICDISGSMDRYSRMLLQFVHTLESGLDNVEVFVFGTRLTRITRELRKRNVDQAIADVVNAVDDWSGGTRIGEAVREFNYRWSRRVLRSNATVVMISDGWDRGDPFLLGEEMARLQRSCRRLIWLNPLLGAPGYQPLTQGIRAALPYVDHFMPVHNLQSLEALAELLGSVEDNPPLRRQQGADAFRHGRT
jgi:uncharacterized protein